MATETADTSISYCEEYLPRDILEKLEAGAFRSLQKHLQERSDEVQNIDLMTLSGFCRNCLAKWMVLEARNVSDEMKTNETKNSDRNVMEIIQALDALGYDEAAQYVYGMGYNDWKKKYSKKATDEQMQRFNDSKPLQAKHNKELLQTRAEKPTTSIIDKSVTTTTTTTTTTEKKSGSTTLLSNVCCTDVDNKTTGTSTTTSTTPSPAVVPNNTTRTVPPYVPPNPPPSFKKFNLSILTVSDRASLGQYETGDLSGPAVQKSVEDTLQNINNENNTTIQYNLIHKDIVPDNKNDIQSKIVEWTTTTTTTDHDHIDIIFTTGGTGFAPRDITPEATREIIDIECYGLMSFIMNECSRIQPLSALSRAIIGIRQKTIIANLPGNPKGVGEIIPMLLPILFHAIVSIQ